MQMRFRRFLTPAFGRRHTKATSQATATSFEHLAVLILAACLPPLLCSTAAGADHNSGRAVYQRSCVACHGEDGRGTPQSTVGFKRPLPDFTNCASFNKEMDVDWFSVIYLGGPARGWSTIMPAFGSALSRDEITQVIAYVRYFCKNKAWPRGDLNLPRALVTEKAFPEGEVVTTTSVNASDPSAIGVMTVYEKRFGPLDQLEIQTPVNFERKDTGTWMGGIGDVTLGWKRVLLHNLNKGSILSASGELIVPSGNRYKGFGNGTKIFEFFGAYGQLLPKQSHIQFQAGAEFPTDTSKAPRAAYWRTAVGKTIRQNHGFGRAWTPMIELVADREFDTGAKTNWDVVPQIQVTLSRRQHIMANLGLRIPATNTADRPVQVMFYLLWDYLDGGLREGW